MIRLDIDAYSEFGRHIQIPSRDAGMVPYVMWGPQRYWIQKVAAGLERGIHDFVTLKGARQIGGTTAADVMALYWPMSNEGIQGMVVSDEDPNMEYRRDVLREMLASLPRDYRLPTAVDNREILRWPKSRLSFRAAGIRAKAKLGRSRGLNFLHADEVGAWPDLKATETLRGSLSKINPLRLYLWNSTAQGIGSPFHEMVKTAQSAITQEFIFLAWWMHELYRLVKPGKDADQLTKELWGRYATRSPNEDERLMAREVKRRFGHAITAEQFGWYRWQLEEEMHGDEAMLAQEYGSLPEDCFQAFGDKFISPAQIRRLRADISKAPTPHGLRYEWGKTLDTTEVKRTHVHEAPLLIWEEPDPGGIYLVAGHPSWSSSAEASQFIAQVYRIWPDKMIQVAEYQAETGLMYQFAWTLLHLAGAYRTPIIPAYFILELTATGYRVLEEMQLIERYGYGLSGVARKRDLADFLGSVRHYYYARPDNIGARSMPQDWKTSADTRPWILNGLRDTIERGHMEIRSVALIDELQGLRQGEKGDNDQIAGGGQAGDARVMCAAIAVECWMKSAMPDLEKLIARKELSKADPKTVEQRLVQNWLGNMLLNRR